MNEYYSVFRHSSWMNLFGIRSNLLFGATLICTQNDKQWLLSLSYLSAYLRKLLTGAIYVISWYFVTKPVITKHSSFFTSHINVDVFQIKWIFYNGSSSAPSFLWQEVSSCKVCSLTSESYKHSTWGGETEPVQVIAITCVRKIFKINATGETTGRLKSCHLKSCQCWPMAILP